MTSILRAFPFLTPAQAIVMLRIATAIFFMAHAVVRVYNGTVPGFAEFLAARSWPMALVIVWSTTMVEIVSGVLLIAGRCVRWGVAALLFIDLMGIVIIHAKLGWFVGEHGTGGVEYSLALAVSLLTIAAADRATNSLDGTDRTGKST